MLHDVGVGDSVVTPLRSHRSELIYLVVALPLDELVVKLLNELNGGSAVAALTPTTAYGNALLSGSRIRRG